ncbi:hypothetical protein V6K52_09225 [Knoellia sp. S7-12]|uniref:hypothetical protein n=1 Tax=Knoellia sp. S7-12 TaxID=3126698 RepID=UPI003369A6E8
MARYVVSDDYAPQFLQTKGESLDMSRWGSLLLQMCPRDHLLVALAAASRAAGAGESALEEWEEYVLSHVEPALAKALLAGLKGTDGGPRRVLLARQPVLLATRLALTEPPPQSPTGTADPAVVATMLSHFAARSSYSSRRATSPDRRLGGIPEGMALEIVANGHFNASFDFGDRLARTYLLWTEYESRLERYRPRIPLRELVREATGMTVIDLLVLAFGIFAHADASRPDLAPPLDLARIGLPGERIERFLARFSATATEFARQLAGGDGDWMFLPFEDRPLLRLGPGQQVVVLDIQLFKLRVTSALYWLVHDHEKASGERQRGAWTQVYSELVEICAEEILRGFAAPQHTFFTEEALAPLGGKAVDCGVDFGDFVFLADVVQHQLTVPTRMLLDADAFEKDMRLTVMTKVKQLDGSAAVLLERAADPLHPLGRRPQRIVPVVVQGADFPVNRVTVRYAREKALEAGWLTQPECTPLVMCTLEELEMVATVVNNDVDSAEDLLRAWVHEGGEEPLRNFIFRRYGGSEWERPARMQQALTEILDRVEEAFAALDG